MAGDEPDLVSHMEGMAGEGKGTVLFAHIHRSARQCGAYGIPLIHTQGLDACIGNHQIGPVLTTVASTVREFSKRRPI